MATRKRKSKLKKQVAVKKRKPQDLTLRNLRATKRREAILNSRINTLEEINDGLIWRLRNLEKRTGLLEERLDAIDKANAPHSAEDIQNMPDIPEFVPPVDETEV